MISRQLQIITKSAIAWHIVNKIIGRKTTHIFEIKAKDDKEHLEYTKMYTTFLYITMKKQITTNQDILKIVDKSFKLSKVHFL